MIIKFKNGYSVKIADSAGKSKEELIALAKKAVMKCQDAVSLEKRIDTNISFMPMKMKAAIATEDQDMFDRELKFLARDLEADLSESHKNYTKTYRPEVLEKLLKQYEEAAKLVEKADDKFGTHNANVVYNKIAKIRENWNMKPKESIEDALTKTIAPIDAGEALESIRNKLGAKQTLNTLIKVMGPETTKKIAGDISISFGEPSPLSMRTLIELTDIDLILDEIMFRMPHAELAKYLEIIAQRYNLEIPELKSDDVKDARDIPPYRVKITYANGEVTIKYVDDLTAAVKDIRRRIEAGKKDGNKVAVALVFDSMTDEIVLSSDRDEDIKVKDADGDMKDPAVLAYIEYVDHGAKEKKFENADAARAELKKLLEIAKKTGEPVALAAILNADTEDVIEEVYRADTEVKDAPPPYYDPTDYPSIKSDYSIDRLSREARHLEKGSPILSELDDVHSEIDELIAKGSDALIDAGWSKDDARRAIATRYTALEKELRKNNLKDEARELHKKIRALEKAWDLRV